MLAADRFVRVLFLMEVSRFVLLLCSRWRTPSFHENIELVTALCMV
jgi:hypothetical protein